MFKEGQIPIGGLLEGYDAALGAMGYRATTRLLFIRRAETIIRRHENQGMEFLNPEIIADYAREIQERHFAGEMKRRYHERAMREIERFVSYACTGSASALPSPLRGSKVKLTPEFARIADEFLSGDFHPNTRCDMRWTVHRYFAWLEEEGFRSLENVEAAHLQKFLLRVSERYAPSSVYDMRLYLKKLYEFLFKRGYSACDYGELLSFSVNRERKVVPSLPKADIAKLLDSINRDTVKGKRDYAIMLLGTVLGLRACEVVALKLTDIDWMRGEIRVVQSKTSVPVALPLTQDVGEALRDYILNGRPASETNRIFLRAKAPYTPLVSAVTLGEVYERCCVAAGLPASKKFHNLRRALGTSMVSNGVSVYDVAQVFGDKNVESVKPYLAADEEHLKMCSLSFDGIAPRGGDV